MKKIIITMGEPAGIGAEVIVKALEKKSSNNITICGDYDLLQQTAQANDINLEFQLYSEATKNNDCIKIIPIKTKTKPQAGKLDSNNAEYVFNTLEQASEMLLRQEFDALVTAPIQKSILSSKDKIFQGHTEFFANRAGCKPVMLLASPKLKVATATTHIPIKDVPSKITKNHLIEICTIIHQELQQKLNIAQPEIIMCGLNPHAGEDGVIGTEEVNAMIPAVNELNRNNIAVTKPIAADTAFTEANFAKNKVILSMYHDQGLAPFKALSFGNSTNITLGLPYFRSSVDHGTALEIAGKGIANSSSMEFAISTAIGNYQ